MLFHDYVQAKLPLFVLDQFQSSKWVPPTAGWIKINCDALFEVSSLSASIAAVARVQNGVLESVFTEYLKDCSSVA